MASAEAPWYHPMPNWGLNFDPNTENGIAAAPPSTLAGIGGHMTCHVRHGDLRGIDDVVRIKKHRFS